MTGDVGGERWGEGVEWLPAGIGDGVGIAIGVGLADPGYGPPKVDAGIVLTVPRHDPGIGQSDIEQREQPRTLDERKVGLPRQYLGDMVQVPRWLVCTVDVIGPEESGLGLIRAALAAVSRPVFLHITEDLGVVRLI